MKTPKNYQKSNKYRTTEYNKHIGTKYNELTVLDFPGVINDYTQKNGKARQLPAVHVKCSCNKEKIISWYSLKNNHIKSCGHINRLYKEDPFEASVRALYTRYLGRARKDKKEFSLTQTEFRNIITKNCFYCGDKPSQQHKIGNVQAHIIHNGIDRFDNTKGYTLENSRPCCKVCNRAKSDLTINEFYNYIQRLTKFASVKKSSKNGN